MKAEVEEDASLDVIHPRELASCVHSLERDSWECTYGKLNRETSTCEDMFSSAW